MADNVTANAGSGGAVFATDDIGSVHYPITKQAFGPLNTATLVEATVGLPVGDAGGSLTVDNAQLSVVGSGTEAAAMRVTIATDSTGVLSVDDNGAGLTVDNAGTFAVQETGAAMSIHKSLDLDESEEEVKATAGTVYGLWVTNTATTTRFLKFYNLTAANTSVGTSVPVITIGIPGNTSDDIAGNFGPGGLGIAFSTAISVAVTTVAADNDATAPGTGDVIVAIFFK